MRVITGTARGRRLQTLSGEDVRPTTDRVKEAVFSIIQFEVEGRRFLDLFAGSGQMGIEALSRGAASATFIDSSQHSLDVVMHNLRETGFTDRAQIVKGTYASFLLRTNERFDIAFLDPPYGAGLLPDALMQTEKVMQDYGVILCEHPGELELPAAVGRFSAVRRYRYGKIFVTMYRKEA
ncbi:MAG: 16S rRNA (guanine(966)-N(2))-methyltransferase RsmD [Candidatus Howiella sp.]|jgi:16S rRNA (guanine966-N2)-methyltransferase